MIWKHLGFSRNIFFVEPLAPIKEEIDLFVGRDRETKEYLMDVFSNSRALKIVSGDVGVGKTTFVNACQYFSYIGSMPFQFEFDLPRMLPCFEKIQIEESDTIEVLLTKSIVSICQSVVYHSRLTSTDPPKVVKETLSFFLDLSIGTGGSGFSGGVDLAGFGGSMGKTAESTTPNVLRNPRIHLKNLVDLARDELGFNGVFVVVNNLDILPKSKLISLMNAGRDQLFDIQGLYWTLIGRKGLGTIIETEAERVADYLSGTETSVGSLDFPTTKQIIDKRVAAFRQNPSVSCPLTDDSIGAFYFLSVQELRETLRICGEITKKILLIDPSIKVIPNDSAMQAFIGYAHDKAKDLDLSDSKVRVLKSVFERRSCRPKDFRDFGYNYVQGFITALKGLVGKRLLSVEERGRARIYRMTGMTMIAAMTGALGEEIMTAAKENLKMRRIPEVDRFRDAQLELQLDDQNDI